MYDNEMEIKIERGINERKYFGKPLKIKTTR